MGLEIQVFVPDGSITGFDKGFTGEYVSTDELLGDTRDLASVIENL